MKKTLLMLLTATIIGLCQAQEPMTSNSVPMSFDTVGADTARAIKIVERYLGIIDFSRLNDDSVLCVTSQIIDQSSPNDTITVYRWYKNPRYNRIEIWQGGKMVDGYYSDGVKLFRSFHKGRREWANITQETYYGNTIPLDIRGALYDWRSKGAELFYAGEYNYKGRPLDRVFVTSPNLFDRYYFFEKESGFLGFLVEDEHIYGDAEAVRNALRVDWRAWSEFTPVHQSYMPSVESYQSGSQIVVLYHSYHFVAPDLKIFTEDYFKR